jgi:hypothetical protein
MHARPTAESPCMPGKGPVVTAIAINGLGRIGRASLKVALTRQELRVVAVNNLIDPENLVYLLRFDSAYRRYDRAFATFEHARAHITAGGQRVVLTAPAKDADAADARTMLVGVNGGSARRVGVVFQWHDGFGLANYASSGRDDRRQEAEEINQQLEDASRQRAGPRCSQ